MLDFLKSEQLCQNSTLKELALKKLALIASTFPDRCQTIHLAKIENLLLGEDDDIKFVTEGRIKTTRKILEAKNCRML